MKMAIGATLYHCTINMKEGGITDLEAEEKQYQFCPKSKISGANGKQIKSQD